MRFILPHPHFIFYLAQQEIMKHLAALKKQYREDLESLTQAYENRRRVLKEAMVLYTPAPTADAGNKSNTNAGKSKSKSGKTRSEEKG